MADKKKGERSINTGGGSYYEGSIRTGGDFVGRDQNTVSMGDVTNANIAVGSGSKITNAEASEPSIENLAKLVAEIRAIVAETQLDPRIEKVVDGDFKNVEEELAQPEPAKALVLPSLEKIMKTIALATTAGETFGKLKPMLDQAINWVQLLLK